MLPILHLNGYKIANPCLLARISHEELRHLFRGYGYEPYFVEGDDPQTMHQQMAATLDQHRADIQRIRADAQRDGGVKRPMWPMIVLRTPKGWTCPKESTASTPRTTGARHQVPMGDMNKPEHIKILETWMKSYRPEELFDENGRPQAELAGSPRRASAA